MRDRLTRLRYRWRLWRGLPDHLNRRAAVENYLLACAEGKRELPDQDKCRELAYRLGIPGRTNHD